MGRQRRWSPRGAARVFFAGIGQRKRKAFSFEQLEDRCYFSVSQALNYQLGSLSSDTAEGAAALWQRELAWSNQIAATTNTSNSVAATTFSTRALPTDPLFASQWHLLNTGQEVGNPDFQAIFGVAGEDLNVVPAWNAGYTGAGVLVAVNDSGTQLFHPDLISNLHPTLRYNAISGTNNPSPILLEAGAPHGTAVAGLIGATSNNGTGGVGVAPGVSLVPVRLIGTGTTAQAIAQAFNFSTQNGIDITNNSWGPADLRTAVAMTPVEQQAIRDSIVFGRGGLGTIHVFASGNGGGPAFNAGFQSIGNWDSSAYDGYVSSRYVIAVGGVDHDGMYANADGTFTSYPEAGPSVLVAAPTGSNAALNIADDTGLGSGLWTTDLVGDFGYNAEALPSGFDPDRDFLADPDATSRFNGTSGAAPQVSGVIALILDANPNLSYRDVQEILVRSARQNAQFEIPASGGIPGELVERPLVSPWQTNQIGPFRDPDPYDRLDLLANNPFLQIFDPIADPNIEPFIGTSEFPTRSITSHYEPQPGLFTNGAGFTVSQGYGVYSELLGWGHGVVDAGLAVKLAEQWHTLDQDAPPERTFSTFVVQPGPQTGYTFPSAEKMDDENGAMIVPGGIGGLGGFIDFWDEYFEEIDFDDTTGLPDPDSGPFSGDDPPVNSRGLSYWQFSVPDNQSMEVEWVEVKVSLGGPANDLDYIRVNMTSPDGTVSELNHYYADPGIVAGVYSFQPVSIPAGHLDPAGDIGTGGQFVWTFTTNRNWGESTKGAPIIDAVTGEPVLDVLGTPYERNWELHLENWSTSDYTIDAVEIVWHGKPIAADAQRVQGFVGIDTNSDEEFNYQRSIQTVGDSDFDPLTIRTSDVVRTLDLNQEPFADSQVVQAFRVVNGVAEDTATARFLTGADGNYYFDLVPDEYIIRVSDPLGRQFLEDFNTPAQFQSHFKQEWHITKDWFFAPDRENPPLPGEPGEIFFGTFDNDGDNVATEAPQAFLDGLGLPIASAIKNINFLIKQDAPPQEIVVNGTVFADLNGNGLFDGDDTPAGGVVVYFDANRNGARDPGEEPIVSSEEMANRGEYSITIPAAMASTYSIGVERPTTEWTFTNPADGTLEIFAGPGDVIDGNNFFLDPPDSAFPPGGTTEPGSILGVVFNDRNNNGQRNAGDEGIAGFHVFIDENENGILDDGEAESITSSNGTFFFAEVPPGLVRIDIVEGSAWGINSPATGFREVQLGPAGVVTGVQFALRNLADSDWGDLPVSYNTLSVTGGPSHFVVIGANGAPGFYLGSRIDGEVDGQPTADATGDDALGQDDDGVVILTNGGELQPGSNTLQVTVAGIGGILNGWIDWNDNGQFDASEHLEFQYALGTSTQADLNPGTHQLTITAPSDLAGGPLAARFRWGEAGLGPTGPAQFGEVEDYILASSVPADLVGDYDSNGVVDIDDLLVWNATFGSTTDLRADGSKNGEVDIADYVLWRKAYMDAQAAGGSSVASGSGSGSTSTAVSASQPSTSSAPSQVPTPVLGWALDSAPPELLAWVQSSKLWSQIQALGYIPRSFGVAPQVAQGGSLGSTGSSGVVLHGPTVGPVVAPPAVDNSATTSEPGAAASPANVVIVSTRPSYRPESGRFVSASVAVVAASDNSLLLVDQALADFNDDTDDAGDDSLVGYIRTDDKDESVSDLALAAVLEDEASWWSSI